MTMIKDLPAHEKPREKALRYGIRALSSRELLAIMLRSGQKGRSVLEIADSLLLEAKGISGIARMDINELARIKGISKTKALEIQACFEISRRCALEEALKSDIIEHPEALVRWLHPTEGFLPPFTFIPLFEKNGMIVRGLFSFGLPEHIRVTLGKREENELLVNLGKKWKAEA